MIPTEYFSQLSPSPLSRIRNRYRTVDRRCLPITLSFLTDCGLEAERVSPLRALAGDDRKCEMVLAAVIILRVFEHQPLHCRGGIRSWLRRKGGCPQNVLKKANAFVDALVEEEEQQYRPPFPEEVRYCAALMPGYTSANEDSVKSLEPRWRL